MIQFIKFYQISASIYLDFYLLIHFYLKWYGKAFVSCGADYSMELAWIRNDEKRAEFLSEIQLLTNNTLNY